jgi:hydrogenase expression/formation protein HypD
VIGADAAAAAPRVRALVAALAATCTRPWTLMEVCGGQTHVIVGAGLDQLLPPGLRLIHGPGCPVCVTGAVWLDQALALTRLPGLILCSYGDMLRVPGSSVGTDLLAARAAGGDVRLVTSPLQVLALARAHPQRPVVFLAVGFETTAPATALLARQALTAGLANLWLLCAHVRVVPAMAALLADPACPVQGFLAAGHVGAVMGTAELAALVERWRRPVVVSGFTPEELLRALLAAVTQLEAGQAHLANCYGQVVRPAGNPAARALLAEVFEVVDRPWRGLGTIAAGGLALRPPYDCLDAQRRFGSVLAMAAAADATAGAALAPPQPSPCLAGSILQGKALPSDCPAFGGACTPEHPLGAPMVSSEGACAAYHRYRPVAVHRS